MTVSNADEIADLQRAAQASVSQDRPHARPAHRQRSASRPCWSRNQSARRLYGQQLTKLAKEIKLDERNHVEKPLLDQLAGLGWEVIDLDSKQHPGDTFRESFTEVVMLPVLREQLKVINPWLEDDQVEEVVKQLTASFPGTGLIQNNRHVFQSAAGKHQREREPQDRREEPDGALH